MAAIAPERCYWNATASPSGFPALKGDIDVDVVIIGGGIWDCPCHGSRFGLDGEVIHGPASKPLARK